MATISTASNEPSPHVRQSIATAAQRTGVPFAYLFNQARTESGFNPAAKAPTSTASGLFQFTRQTWLATLDAHGEDHGLGWTAAAIRPSRNGFTVDDPALRQAILDLREDPAIASAMAAELASDNQVFLSGKLDRDVTATDLSLAHFLGAEGAAKFLAALDSDPNAAAAPLFPEAAAANRNVFYDRSGAALSLTAIHARFADKAGRSAPRPTSTPAVIVAQRQSSAAATSTRWAAATPDFAPMPRHLSLPFAEAAYRRLSALDGGESR